MARFARNMPRLSGLLTRSSFRGRIGLMGGSFNPPHLGHLAMAKRARALAGLDKIMWLVSPQNPLKSSAEMANFDARFTACRKMAEPHGWLIVSDFETHIQMQSGHQTQPITSAETLMHLRRLLPLSQLIWIMGADNLIQFHKWDNHDVIKDAVDLLILGRPGYSYRALASEPRHQLGPRNSPRRLGKSSGKYKTSGFGATGKWAFDTAAHNLLSATQLRHSGKGL